ncbi:MAG: metallophosphoesterase [Candidatus Pacebacteria bacterium]|nr:metallophosphoesterase [Candidatus Paceibacterota bacterium]
MKFAILTDIHLGPEGHYKGVLRKMNNNVKPEFVVILGDLVEDDNKVNDRNNIDYIIKLLIKLKCPVHYVAGNHDLQNISEEELIKLFKQESLYYSFDKNEFHIIVLYTKAIKHKNVFISEEQISWLKNDLEKTNKKTIIFSHHSLADQDLTGNPWFEGKPEYCLVTNRKIIRNIISTSKKVIAVFNSHLHWDRQDIHNNIPYFTIQSLTENEDDKGLASETHAVVNIVGDNIGVEIKGNYSKKFLHKK